jgi:hypothetical protein
MADVVVDQRARRQQPFALQRLPVLLELGRSGGTQSVRGTADRAEGDALVLDVTGFVP